MPRPIRLPEYEWSENPREVDYQLPDSWDVTTYNIAGADRPVMNAQQIRAAIASPIGSLRIRDIARGRKKVVVIFDDLARPTPAYAIAPIVLEELKEAGIADSQIEFICGQGMHQAWDRIALARKIGGDVIARFPVFSHVPFMNCTPLGRTSYGSKVEVNSEVMSCDLKITITGVVPHPTFGFGGGGKIVMPGVSSYEAIVEHHGVTRTHQEFKEKRRQAGLAHEIGIAEGNPLTLDALEMAKMAGIDFSINVIVNHLAQPVAIFAGALEPAYWAAVKEGMWHYRVTVPTDNDIVIANAFGKVSESYSAARCGTPLVAGAGGDMVLMSNSELGMVFHYLTGSHGTATGGKFLNRIAVPPNVNHFIYYSEYPEMRTLHRFDEAVRPRVLMLSKWDDVVSSLMKWHPGRAKVAVLADATIQILT